MTGFLYCSKTDEPKPTPLPANFIATSWSVNNITGQTKYNNVNHNPVVRIAFGAPIDRSKVNSAITFKDKAGSSIAYTATYERNDSTVILTPASSLEALTQFQIVISQSLRSQAGGSLTTPFTIDLVTTFSNTDKFPRVSDEQLLDIIQKQTFKYFWDFGHPVSGLARERNTSGDIVTSGGSGFGIMSIVTAIHRQYITRAEGLARMQKIVDFLQNKAQKFHGAFPHWLNGVSGLAQPFSTKDNGADLVETSYLMQGLLTARQFFNSADPAEVTLRNNINTLWNGVEWSWFRKGNENVLYWHWSPDYLWQMNHPVRGWNEALITYVLAASSPTYSIPKIVYDNGWASNGNMKNGKSYYGIQLPLGPEYGGPLFFAHYSFLGINPVSLTDAYANYLTQNTAHTLINYNYCKENPRNYTGYSDSCWGLTASDDINGYRVHDPVNDNSVISPTAALSSFPYTPSESMKALKFFYYKIGDKIFKEYGFVDAFSLHETWFANSFLAIDQGPIIVMIENHRSGLLWNLFMSCPEVKNGMTSLGFQSPNL